MSMIPDMKRHPPIKPIKAPTVKVDTHASMIIL